MSDRLLALRAGRVCLVVLAAASVAAGCAGRPAAIGLVASGEPVSLPTPGTLDAASAEKFQGMIVGSKGRPVVVNVWASWCGPCRVEAPLLERAFHRYSQRVTFLGINAQDASDPALEFMRRYKITYPNAADPDGSVSHLLSLRGLPTTYVFDRGGRVRASVLGGISEQTLAARLREVLDR